MHSAYLRGVPTVAARCAQAYRHLYVLATEQRCVHTVDVHTQMPVVVPLAITLKQGPSSQLQQPVAGKPSVLPILEPQKLSA